MTITQISVFLDNTPGALHEIAFVLKNNKIDIRALSLADTSDFGVLRLIVDDAEQAFSALKKHGFTVSKNRVIGIAVSDVPGGFEEPLRVLNDNGIAVEYVYAFVSRQAEKACAIIRTDNTDKAVEVLKSSGISLFDVV